MPANRLIYDYLWDDCERLCDIPSSFLPEVRCPHLIVHYPHHHLGALTWIRLQQEMGSTYLVELKRLEVILEPIRGGRGNQSIVLGLQVMAWNLEPGVRKRMAFTHESKSMGQYLWQNPVQRAPDAGNLISTGARSETKPTEDETRRMAQ